MPERIQRRRTKGWRMPKGAVYVGRPTVFGNPFRAYKCDCCGYWDVRDDNGMTYLVDHKYVQRHDIRVNPFTWTTKTQAERESVRLYGDELTYWLGGRMKWDPAFREAVEALRGRDLVCWCPLDRPCHADVLLDLANRTGRHCAAMAASARSRGARADDLPHQPIRPRGALLHRPGRGRLLSLRTHHRLRRPDRHVGRQPYPSLHQGSELTYAQAHPQDQGPSS